MSPLEFASFSHGNETLEGKVESSGISKIACELTLNLQARQAFITDPDVLQKVLTKSLRLTVTSEIVT